MINKYFDSALFIASITAILYCAYSRYLIGFYEEFGIEYELIDKNIHQILFYGMHVIFFPIFKILTLSIVTLSLLYFSFIELNKTRIFKLIITTKLFNNILIKYNSLISKNGKFYLFRKLIISTYILWIFLIITGIILDYFKNTGADSATKIIKQIESGTYDRIKINIDIDNNVEKLYIVSCGNAMCAGYDNVKKRIYYFQSSNHFYSDISCLKKFE